MITFRERNVSSLLLLPLRVSAYISMYVGPLPFPLWNEPKPTLRAFAIIPHELRCKAEKIHRFESGSIEKQMFRTPFHPLPLPLFWHSLVISLPFLFHLFLFSFYNLFLYFISSVLLSLLSLPVVVFGLNSLIVVSITIESQRHHSFFRYVQLINYVSTLAW